MRAPMGLSGPGSLWRLGMMVPAVVATSVPVPQETRQTLPTPPAYTAPAPLQRFRRGVLVPGITRDTFRVVPPETRQTLPTPPWPDAPPFLLPGRVDPFPVPAATSPPVPQETRQTVATPPAPTFPVPMVPVAGGLAAARMPPAATSPPVPPETRQTLPSPPAYEFPLPMAPRPGGFELGTPFAGSVKALSVNATGDAAGTAAASASAQIEPKGSATGVSIATGTEQEEPGSGAVGAAVLSGAPQIEPAGSATGISVATAGDQVEPAAAAVGVSVATAAANALGWSTTGRVWPRRPAVPPLPAWYTIAAHGRLTGLSIARGTARLVLVNDDEDALLSLWNEE